MYCLTGPVLFLMFLLFFSGAASGQQIQAVQISPAITAQTGAQQPAEIPPLKTAEQPLQGNGQPGLSGPLPSAEAPSEFERFIAGNVPSEISTGISQFGYGLFGKSSSAFTPATNVPVSSGYVLGPGDGMRITIWGKVEGSWDAVIDRDGNITLPKIGVIGVTGMTFAELRDFLQKEFSKYYTGFEMNVSMGALKTIRVYVVGNALRPGAYTLSSLSTLVNALFETGGPDKTGTMRDIQVKRNGEVAGHFDMYDFLLKGDRTKDMRLMSEDVIFIPPVGPLAGVAGSVRRPAIYELREESMLLDLIDMAGGLTSTAFSGRVQVQRTEDHQFRTLFEGDLLDLKNNSEKNFSVRDGDLVKVYSVSEIKNTVRLSGAVVSPGEYAIIPGMTRLSDVIYKSGGLLYYASSQSELTRVSVSQSGPETEFINVDVANAMKGDPEHDVLLEINDYIFIRTVPEWRLYQTVTVAGEVRYPGTYTILKGETLSSLIKRAGGYTDEAYLRGAVFTKESVRDSQQKGLVAMVERIEKELNVSRSSEVATSLTIEVIEAKKAEYEQKGKFIDMLRQHKATGRVAIRLAHPRLLKGTEHDIELEQGDSLFIPRKSSVINVMGSVMSQGSFVYSEKMRFGDYIEMAGGSTKYADTKNVYVLKVDGTAKKLDRGFTEWNSSRSRWEMTAFSEDIKDIEPGDTIVVPEKLDRIAWLREIKDLTQILYQIAVTAGVAIVVF